MRECLRDAAPLKTVWEQSTTQADEFVTCSCVEEIDAAMCAQPHKTSGYLDQLELFLERFS